MFAQVFVPGVGVVAVKTATVAMGNYSAETVEVMKELRETRERAQRNLAACQRRLADCPGAPTLPRLAGEIEPYVVEINFEAIPDPARRAWFWHLPTSFKLTGAAPEFKELLESLGAR